MANKNTVESQISKIEYQAPILAFFGLLAVLCIAGVIIVERL